MRRSGGVNVSALHGRGCECEHGAPVEGREGRLEISPGRGDETRRALDPLVDGGGAEGVAGGAIERGGRLCRPTQPCIVASDDTVAREGTPTKGKLQERLHTGQRGTPGTSALSGAAARKARRGEG